MLDSLFHLSGVRSEALSEHLSGFDHKVDVLNLSARLHDFDDYSFDGVPSVIFYLTLDLILLNFLLSLRDQDSKFIFVEVTLVV
jgi:hypothetical protein